MMEYLAHTDLRWVTAICQGFIGLVLVGLAVRVWMMPLHMRAVAFEPFLTARGVRVLLKSWPLVFVVGLFFIVSGASKWAYYARWHGTVNDAAASGFGLLEAVFAIWAAGSVTVVTVRAWRG